MVLYISAGQRQGEVCKMCAQAELSLSGPSSFDGTSLGLHGLRPSVCMTERAAVPKALNTEASFTLRTDAIPSFVRAR